MELVHPKEGKPFKESTEEKFKEFLCE